VDVSACMIYNVTEAVVEEVKIWQGRSLDEVYPILYMDALHVKIRDGGHVMNKAIYVAVGVNMEGKKEVLGLWAAQNEGAKFWLQVMTELKNRGVKDIFVACVDGLKGFPDAIETVFPNAEVQLCIVHMVRASLSYVNWKQRKEVAGDLKKIYQSATKEEAELQLEEFAEKWDETYPMVSQVWRRNWSGIIPFFAYPGEIRKAIYTTNAIESLNMSLRKILKTRGSFPTEDAAMKLLYLALSNASKKWTMPIQNWSKALNRFAILWPERMPALERAA
jgi:putative transposase